MMFLKAIRSSQTNAMAQFLSAKNEVQKTGEAVADFSKILHDRIAVENIQKYENDQKTYDMQFSKVVTVEVQKRLGNQKFLSNVELNDLEKKAKTFLPEAIKKVFTQPLGLYASDSIKIITESQTYDNFIETMRREYLTELPKTSSVNNLPPVDQSTHLKITQSAVNRGLSGYSSKFFIQPEGRPLRKGENKEKPIVDDHDRAVKSYQGDPLGKKPNQNKSFEASA
jgi:hypothetical protein